MAENRSNEKAVHQALHLHVQRLFMSISHGRLVYIRRSFRFDRSGAISALIRKKMFQRKVAQKAEHTSPSHLILLLIAAIPYWLSVEFQDDYSHVFNYPCVNFLKCGAGPF